MTFSPADHLGSCQLLLITRFHLLTLLNTFVYYQLVMAESHSLQLKKNFKYMIILSGNWVSFLISKTSIILESVNLKKYGFHTCQYIFKRLIHTEMQRVFYIQGNHKSILVWKVFIDFFYIMTPSPIY